MRLRIALLLLAAGAGAVMSQTGGANCSQSCSAFSGQQHADCIHDCLAGAGNQGMLQSGKGTPPPPPPPPTVCGNGVVETGEWCDDGNTADQDACSLCKCADSDGGKNLLVAGFASSTQGEVYDIKTSHVPPVIIVEQSCVAGEFQSDMVDCPPGTTAIQGPDGGYCG